MAIEKPAAPGSVATAGVYASEPCCRRLADSQPRPPMIATIGARLPPSDAPIHHQQMDWVDEVTTVVGTLGGAVVGVRGALAISRNEHDEARRRRVGEAYSAFLSAVVLAVAELRRWPNPGEPNALQQPASRIQDKLYGEGTSDLATRRSARASFGDRPSMLADGVVQAWAVLHVLPLDIDTRSVCDAALYYIERLSGARTDEIKGEWSSVHARLMDAATRLSVEPTPRR